MCFHSAETPQCEERQKGATTRLLREPSDRSVGRRRHQKPRGPQNQQKGVSELWGDVPCRSGTRIFMEFIESTVSPPHSFAFGVRHGPSDVGKEAAWVRATAEGCGGRWCGTEGFRALRRSVQSFRVSPSAAAGRNRGDGHETYYLL